MTPPVTLLLIAYNQERFIGAAVRAALAQDYPNLELILSDDCSPDGTFAVMEAEARAYSGPHRVVVRQTARNLGMVPHVYDAAALATGELIVAAAGDDVSYPHRLSSLVRRWQASGADALSSNWDVIDERGGLVRRGRPPGEMDLRLDRYFEHRRFTQITGATAAYSRAVFEKIPQPPEPIFAEDLYLALMLHWRGRKVEYVDEPLVGYRIHQASATHSRHDSATLVEQERGVERHSLRNAGVLSLFERLTLGPAPEDGWGAAVSLDRRVIAEDIAFNRFRARWLQAGFAERVTALLKFRDPAHRRWLLPRLFGISGVGLLRRLRALARRSA